MQKVALINNNTIKKPVVTERYTEPGLVTFCDIRPENGAGLFLQPWSPHWACVSCTAIKFVTIMYRGT